MSHDYTVSESVEVHSGRVISLRRDVVAMPDGQTSQRDVVVHPGAVGVVALDDDGRVVLVRQYRHPVRRELLELPAGLLDVDGESAADAAARELFEEAHLRATTWHVLVDALTSPGMTDEAVRVYLAGGIREADGERYAGEHEEAAMTVLRMPLDDAVDRVLAGEIENAMCCLGLLATFRARSAGWTGLRPVDAPWRARPTRA